MPLPPWHRLELKLVTTAFFGYFPKEGVTHGQIPFPIPSLRGVLAYWLRALAGPYVGDDTTWLRRVESELFGTAAGEGPARPSRILLRGERIPVTAPPTAEEASAHYAGLAYLMGQGLTGDKGPMPRRVRPRDFTVMLRNLGDPLHADLFSSALWALRTFGGIGARSRRGFGTLAVKPSLRGLPLKRFQRDWLMRDDMRDLDGVRECVEAALADLGVPRGSFASTPAYPCFLQDLFCAEEHLIEEGGDDLACLAAVGKRFRDFRRPRMNSKERQITRGYDEVIRPFIEGRRPVEPFVDGAFGLPVNYRLTGGQGSGGEDNATVEPVINDEVVRRASPLWLRVNPVGGATRLRSLAFFKEWLPERATLRVKATRSAPVNVAKPSPAQVRETVEAWFDSLMNSGLEPRYVLGTRMSATAQ